MPEDMNFTEEQIAEALKAVEELDNQRGEIEKVGNLFNKTVDDPFQTTDKVQFSRKVNEEKPIEVKEPEYEDIYSNSADEKGTNVETTEKTEENEFEKGQIVTLDPDIAEKIEGYDPNDIFRVVKVEDGLAELTRNGKAVDELSYVPVENLTAYNYTDPLIVEYERQQEIEETTVEEDKPIVEKGSKPIRWAKHFIDKVKRNVTVEGINQKLEESKQADQENLKLTDKDLEGNVTSFQTKLYNQQLKLATKASAGWKKMKDWLKKDKDSENTEQKNGGTQSEQGSDDKINETIQFVTGIIEEENNPYKKFDELSEDKKEGVFNTLVASIKESVDVYEENDALKEYANNAVKKVTEAENKLSDSQKALNDATNTITGLQAEIERLKAEVEKAKAEKVGNNNSNTTSEGQVTNQSVEEINDPRFRVFEVYKKQYDEQKEQEERRRTLEQEQDKLWNEDLAPLIDNKKIVYDLEDSARDAIETEKQVYYNSVLKPETEKREELLNQNRINAVKNKLAANAILGNVTPEMIANINQILDANKNLNSDLNPNYDVNDNETYTEEGHFHR